MKNTFRRFCVERSYYFDTHDGNKNLKLDALSEEEWKKMIMKTWLDLKTLGADEVIMIFHDSDIDKDGNPKGLHAHAVVHFENQRSEKSVAELFGASSVMNCKHCKNYSGSIQYLLHITQDAINEMKTIYMPEKIIAYAIKDGKKTKLTVRDIQERMRRVTNKQKAEVENVKSQILSDVMKGKMLAEDVAEVYEADEQGVGFNLAKYFKDVSEYKKAEQHYMSVCARFYQRHPHPSTLIYIYGDGGTGKTTLANAIAERFADVRGIHFVSAPGKSTTFDFAGQYRGQKVSIFNETSPDSLRVEQFLDIFDPQRAAMVNSRHADKPYFAECAIFTASMPLEKYLYELWRTYARDNANLPVAIRRNLANPGTTEADWHNAYIAYGGSDVGNKIAQLRRRFAVVIKLQDGLAHISVFDKRCNPSYSLLYTSTVHPSVIAFVERSTMMYDVNRDSDTVDMLKRKTVDAVVKAIRYYYEYNGFALPETYAKPFGV